MNRFQISFDPGMSGVGIAVWQNGVFSGLFTLRPKGKTHLEKLVDLKQQLNKFYLSDVLYAPGSEIDEIVFESWERYLPRFKVASMMKSAEGRGLLIGVSLNYCDNIRYVSKGKTKKDEAQFLAQCANIEGSSHAKDAYHLGLLAGFGDCQKFLDRN